MKKSMPTVIYIGPSRTSRGGISSVIKSYMESTLSRDYSLYLIETQNDKSFFKKISYALSAILKAPYCFLKSDIIHIHTASYNSFYRKIYFILLSQFFSAKLIIHIHGGGFSDFLNTNSSTRKNWIINLIRKADCLLCLSPLIAANINAHVNHKKLAVINNPCQFHIPAPVDKPLAAVTILFAGWVEKEKGVFDLISAFSKVRKIHGNCRLVIAGKGRIADAEKMAEELSLTDDITFTGWLQKEEMQDVLEAADIFCLPSYREGVPMSILEAMGYGLPVLATPVGGVPDIISPGKTGMLVTPGNREELAGVLIKLIDDRTCRLSIGTRARKYIVENCSIDVVAEKVSSLYKGLLGD